MTDKQKELIDDLRLELLRNNYPKIFVVDKETLIAAECALSEHLKELGLPEILQCGKNGLWFKGCELVLEAKFSA